MEIHTKYHGVIEAEQKDILHFQNGIPGFLEVKSFVLLKLDQESPFYILQSTETAELAFVVVNPFQFFTTYEFDLSDSDKAHLKLTTERDVVVYTILNVKDPFEESTANLQAPIVLNSKSNEAKQIILNDLRYKTNHRLFSEEAVK